MGTIERQEIQPVFAAADGRRERVLRIAGRLAAVVVVIWLAALLAGAIGFGKLPGLPGAGLLQRNGHPAKAPPADPAVRSDLGTSLSDRPTAVDPAGSSRVSGQAAATRSSRSHVPVRPVARAVVHPAPVQAATPPASPGNPQGRAVRRHGNQTPLPPPPPPPGNAYGNSGTPPGQLRKQPPPPPPPPPPPG